MVFAGKIIPCKNMVEFSHQFADYISSVGNSNLKLLIIGDGVQSDKLARHEHILRMPFQNQSRMPAVYKAADILVLPSISETWGLAVNEGNGSRHTRNCYLKGRVCIRLVKDGQTGFILISILLKPTAESLRNLRTATSEPWELHRKQ